MNVWTRDLLGSISMLVFVISLWVQRDSNAPFGAISPDIVIGCVVVLIVITIAAMFTPWCANQNGEKNVQPAGSHWVDMIIVDAILAAWTVMLRPLGVIATGFLEFSSISWFLNEKRKSIKGAVMSAVVGAGMVFLLILVFEYLPEVSPPKGSLFD